MNDRKQGSTTYPMQFFMTLASDHLSGAVGLSPTVTISKNGAALAAAAGAVTEVGSGWYSLAGNATDRNTLGEFLIHATGTGADPADKSYVIVPWDPFDANLALQALPAAAAGATGGLPTVDGSNGVKLSVGTGTGQMSLTTGQVTTGTLNDKTGMALSAAGVDLIIVETGLNLRQSQSIALAALAGILSGAGTTTITIDGAGVATVRIVATVDASGNRSALTLTPPT